MKVTLERRIAALEQRKSAGNRQIHIIKAVDDESVARYVAELAVQGRIGPHDGLVYLTGMPGGS